eukprot:scaffold8917_cov200-Skeletonema_dohrnii-CCMP3373.AAC.1
MAIKTDMPHVVSLLRGVSAGDRRIYCGRRLSLSPLLHGDQSTYWLSSSWSWEDMAGRTLSTPQRHDDESYVSG